MKKLFSIFIVLLAIGCSDKAAKTLPLADDPDAQKISDIGDFNKDSFNTSLDILFVIDDSGSMGVHQDNLALNIPQFTDVIIKTKFLDYHIGVISSSTYGGFSGSTGACCGKLYGAPAAFGSPFGTPSNPVYVERSTPDADIVLAQNLIVGTSGSATEQFFDPIIQAFSPTLVSGANAGFYRQNAYLAIIFITDTDDQSPGTDATAFWNYLVTLKGSSDKIIIGAAYVPDAEFDTCTAEYDIQSSDKLPQLFKTSKALTFSLCDPNYGAKLAEISNFIVSKSRRKLLSNIPDAKTISVSIGGVPIPNDFKKGWSYNAFYNSLEFGPDIEWENYPDGVYPEITYTTIPVSSIPQ